MGLDAQEMEIRIIKYLRMKHIVAALLAAIIGSGGCGDEESSRPLQDQSKPLPDQVISGFSLTETSMGRRDWHMEAEKAYIYEKRNILEAEVIEVTFFDEDGAVRSILRARYGKLNRNSDDMEARGNVVVRGSDGVVLETETLSWESNSRKITSDDSVTVFRNEDVLTGWGFRGDPDLGSFRILRDMKATIRAKGGISEGGSAEPRAED